VTARREEAQELDPYAHELQKRAALREWKQKKQREREEQERARKREELQKYLAERGRLWEDHTGITPSTRHYEEWTQEYVHGKQIEAELEREERINRSIKENYR
jgi:hypothetical protein